MNDDLMKIIVVAEIDVFTLLRDCGAAWDTQHQIESVSQMWEDLSGNRLDQSSSVLVFSDHTYASSQQELESALAMMAPAATTFLIAWDGAQAAQQLVANVANLAPTLGQKVGQIHVLDPTNILDGMRGVLTDTGKGDIFPAVWATPAPVAPQPEPEPVFSLTPAEAPAAPPAPEPVAAPVQSPTQFDNPFDSGSPTISPVTGQVDPLSRPPLPGQVTFAVTSSKGGSGKSTTAMMLAAQISHSSQLAYERGKVARPLKVVLVDMDTRDGQVGSLIGKYLPTALTIRVAPQWDEETILENLVHDERLGIDALLAPVRPRTADDVGPDFYRHVIRMLQRTHDVVIMDTSVNYLDPLISTVCLPEATAILFVTTLATTSVQGMARALREIVQPADKGGMAIARSKIGVVVNQSITQIGMERDQVLQAALNVPIVGAIPLATKDVLTCTNYNQMDKLLHHELLGPAYFRLASNCMPGVVLEPLVGNPAPQTAAIPQTQSAPPAVAQPVGGPQLVAPPTPAAAPEKKRGLFGRGR